jgi:predicted aspartyl protease
MIYGVVNLRRGATLPLVVGNTNKQQQVVDTVIDTGFSGFLSLPSSIAISWCSLTNPLHADRTELIILKSLHQRVNGNVRQN